MAVPSQKNFKYEKLLEKLFNRSSKIKLDTCTACGKEAKIFRDDLSKKEFTISGLCQMCQDEIFMD